MLLLIDYSSMLYRAYHSSPDSIPMHGVHGFLQTLSQILTARKPDRLALAIDEDWRPDFRVQALPMYKAQRVSDVPDPVTPQEQYGRQLLRALAIPVVGSPGYEAEDVIATLVERSTENVEILSGDRDLFALVRDPRVKVLYPQKGGGLEEVTESWITRKYGIPGRCYGDFALLRGDPSDGLPGARGIGEKTAASLITRFGSLDAVMEAAEGPAKVDLAPRLRGLLLASKDYLAAARAVVAPVSDIPLDEVSLVLPGGRAGNDVLRGAEEHSLSRAVERLFAALDSIR